ncbi:B12-binding domain-containing radical SAM protein [Alkaliphilus serpentinus]|uniref:B12-binding domain-containing radical SAM protein n=1 Tax=Alkaliphilus serpentinus TaxID=1482731 RepID=A0A833HNP7_9FIRM|nr:radical SAM protein [Alkaliphilus serpentinus]KAB3529852.1 B12-binding domain-containing radical SAM protein [Alkaliphilus serpentinus]
MKKVLLVNGMFNIKKISEPLGISILASVIKKSTSYKVSIYDPCIDGDSVDIAYDKVLLEEHDVLGISVVGFKTEDIVNFLEKYKQSNRKTTIVIGGHGPSIRPELFLHDIVDAVFIGESEKSFIMYLDRLLKRETTKNLPGIAFKDSNGKIIINEPSERTDNLDDLPFMSRDVLFQLHKKFGDEIAAQIIGSRGCYMNCSYCSVQSFSKLQKGKNYRERSVESIVEEMQNLYNTFRIRKFIFEDDNFVPRRLSDAREKIDKFTRYIKRSEIKNLNFFIQCRPDNLHIDSIDELRKIGLRGIFTGIESINEDELKIYGRVAGVTDVIKKLRELNEIGFKCDVNSTLRLNIGYIMFNPYSSRETLMESVKFLREFNVTPKKLTVSIIPYYNTPIRRRIEKEDLINEDGSIKFKNEEIRQIYSYLLKIINNILDFREILRMPTKMKLELKLNLNDDFFNNLRVEFDKMCYDAFEELLNSRIEDFSKIRDKYYTLVDNYRENDQLVNKINDFYTSLNLKSNTKNIFR